MKLRVQGEEYRLRASDGVELALHRVGTGGGAPVLLAAGTFSAREFWLGPRREGFAYGLAEAGFDPWVLEPRGHGASDRPGSWTIADWVRFDAPAAAEEVLMRTGAPGLFWVGHSAGGVVGAAAAGWGVGGARGIPAGQLRGLVLLGAPGPSGLSGVRRAAAWGAMLAGAAAPRLRFPGRALRMGPEQEPGALIRQWMSWNLSGQWRDPTGLDYLAGLPGVRTPVLAVAGAGDRLLAPPAAVRDLLRRFGSEDRTFVVAGRSAGYSIDFDHPRLVIGQAARVEIWPRVTEWLAARSGAVKSGTT